MTIEFEGGNVQNPVAKCDEPGCPNRLGKPDLLNLGGFQQPQGDWQPHGQTGWTTVESPDGPRHYCAEHAA